MPAFSLSCSSAMLVTAWTGWLLMCASSSDASDYDMLTRFPVMPRRSGPLCMCCYTICAAVLSRDVDALQPDLSATDELQVQLANVECGSVQQCTAQVHTVHSSRACMQGFKRPAAVQPLQQGLT